MAKGNVRLNTVGGVRRRTVDQQTPVPGAKPVAIGDELQAKKNRCSAHMIEYYTLENERVRCPMCLMERDYDEVRAHLLAVENQLKAANGQLNKLRVQVDLQTAIRSAIEILDDNDYGWLKVQMYLYKIDRSVSLKPTHGKLAGGKRIRKGQRLPANGFMTIPQSGDPEAHLATSPGGVAIAEYLDEAITCVGSGQAMGIMLKSWWRLLPGADS